MSGTINVQIDGNQFQLLSERGLFWQQQRALFVADPHFGKEATFRRSGIPVPQGSTIGTLNTISNMLQATAATHLVILGDMFHARSSLSTDVKKSIEGFFVRHADLQITLVRGNHDARVGQLPTDWPIETVAAGTMLGQVAIGHQPTDVPDAADVLLCGHVHPALRIKGRTESLGTLPCFWLSRQCLVLPAIGEFTGTHVIRLGAEDRAWFIAGDEIVEYHATGERHHRTAT